MDTLEQVDCSAPPIPGIVIFSRSMQVRWANQKARDLIARTGGLPNYSWITTGNLPLEVVDLAAGMVEALETRLPEQNWAHIEAHRTVLTTDARFDLRGFGFPGIDEFANFHLVVLITETAPTDIPQASESRLVAHAMRS